MSEKDNLPEADGSKEVDTPQKEVNETPVNAVEIKAAEKETSQEETSEDQDSTVIEEPTVETETTIESAQSSEDVAEDSVINEIEESNAKEAETQTEIESATDEITKTAVIEEKNYSTMAMDALVDEFENLINNQQIQKIKNHAESIKKEFNSKFNLLLDEKKKEFLDEGGNSIDFRFDFPLKKNFNSLYKSYRDKRQDYYKNLQDSLKTNLANRLEIIDEIKGLLNVEENINTTYKHFKALQERWRNAGSIPRDKYNNVWNNYHHHVENFYDFLHLNRDLRDLDFKHNLEQKQKIIERAEELAKDDNSNRAFRELQALHKIWKEELGPVAKEYRDDIWERFKAATKSIHDKRQVYFEKLDVVYQQNLEKKNEIIEKILEETKSTLNNHSLLQKKIRTVEALREEFFKAGKVPIKVNEATWAKFKNAVREFNRRKNAFYKELKKEQYNNLQKKLDLIKIAEEHKDSADFESTTPLMKKIQNDWKNIGHVPRKDSDKIWNQFKGACNHYFDKFHEQKNVESGEEVECFEKKNALLTKLKDVKFGKDLDKNLELIKSNIAEWRDLGSVPRSKRYIEGKFNKTIDAMYGKLKLDDKETELLKYDNKLESLSLTDDKRLLDNEHNFIRKRIDEIESEINQLENNMQFFSNVADDNPLVKDVMTKIDNQKSSLATWRTKLQKIKKFY